MSFFRRALDLTPAILLLVNLVLTITIVYNQKNKILTSILRLVALSITIISANLSLILKAPSLTGQKKLDRYIDYGIAFCQVAIATFRQSSCAAPTSHTVQRRSNPKLKPIIGDISELKWTYGRLRTSRHVYLVKVRFSDGKWACGIGYMVALNLMGMFDNFIFAARNFNVPSTTFQCARKFLNGKQIAYLGTFNVDD